MHHLVTIVRPDDDSTTELLVDALWRAGAVGVEEIDRSIRAASSASLSSAPVHLIVRSSIGRSGSCSACASPSPLSRLLGPRGCCRRAGVEGTTFGASAGGCCAEPPLPCRFERAR